MRRRHLFPRIRRRWAIAAIATTITIVIMVLVTSLITAYRMLYDIGPTITSAEADTRAERLLQEAGAQLPPGATLTLENAEAQDCAGWGGAAPNGQISVERSYKIAYPQNWATDQVLDLLAQYWANQGYEPYSEYHQPGSLEKIFYLSPRDEITVGVELYPPYQDEGPRIFLIATSFCLWEFGTPT